MLATPDLLWLGQCLPAAFRSCTGSPYLRRRSQLTLELVASAYADYSAAFSISGVASLGQGANALLCRNVTFRLTAPGRRYEPLYDLIISLP